MKICKIIIPYYRQFKNFEVDLTYPAGHPRAGEPLDKICFIGRNGTGKTTLLELLNSFIYINEPKSPIILKILHKDCKYYITKIPQMPQRHSIHRQPRINFNFYTNFFKEGIELKQEELLMNLFNRAPDSLAYSLTGDETNNLQKEITLNNNSFDLFIYSPAEFDVNSFKKISDVPVTSLNEALPLFNDFSYYHRIGNDTVSEFWKTLIYLIKKRENDYRQIEELPQNQTKTVKEIKEQFDKANPKILEKLSELWNKILDKAGLEFDYEHARNPIQLNDNLKAYIKLKSNHRQIPYNELSTGIRNFMFKVGHIYSLYFNRNIKRGFLLIDEPENSLFPDFLYELVDTYEQIIHNTQFIVSTHNPIIAAQFEPCERIILDFNEEGYVFAQKGVTPTGDDPNDMLIKDFGIRSLLGKEGIIKWEKFIELKIRIESTRSKEEKSKLMDEYIKIGNEYNFLPQ